MQRFLIATTSNRVLRVEAGGAVTLLRDEFIETVRPEDGKPLSEAEIDWVRSTITPLMKPWGT